MEAAEEIEDAKNAEIQTPELEATEEVEGEDRSSSIEGTIETDVESSEETVDDVDSQF